MATLNSSTDGWALRLPRTAAAQLSALRLISELEIAEAGDAVWLRGRHRDESVDRLLATLPAEERYTWLANDRLQPNGSRLASARFPAAPWQSLLTWTPIRLPNAQLSSALISPATLRLERHFHPQVPNAALIATDVWAEWAATAPLLRLAPLRFAASSEGHSLVLGGPLPAIPSQPWIEREGVIVPAGFAWRPRVTSKVIRCLVGASEGSILLWDDRGVRLLSSELFVPASRAGVRATAEKRP